MTERTFRMILGLTLLVLLYIEYTPFYVVFIALLFFEGITNLRIPILVNQFRFGQEYVKHSQPNCNGCKTNFEAERAMRLVFGAVLIASLTLVPQQLWFINWIIASFLTLAGLVNMCPIVMSLRWVGFR